jgi:hypothetical protein
MKQGSDAALTGGEQQDREEDRWIKSGSRIDLQGMRNDPIHQLARALVARAGLRQPTDALPTFDIGP